MYSKIKELKGRNDPASKEELLNVVDALAVASEIEFVKVVEELDKMKPYQGRIEIQKFWKMKKQLFPRSKDPPSAMLDKQGNLLTTNKSIENRELKVYAENLQPNKIREHLKEHEPTVNKICDIKPKIAKLNIKEPWTMSELDSAVKYLKVNKSRDALDHANKIFKDGVAGSDLKFQL